MRLLSQQDLSERNRLEEKILSLRRGWVFFMLSVIFARTKVISAQKNPSNLCKILFSLGANQIPLWYKSLHIFYSGVVKPLEKQRTEVLLATNSTMPENKSSFSTKKLNRCICEAAAANIGISRLCRRPVRLLQMI